MSIAHAVDRSRGERTKESLVERANGRPPCTEPFVEERTMQPRIKNPALLIPGAMEAMQSMSKTVEHGGLPQKLRELVNLRASQINGCSVCVDMHSRALKKLGEKDERIALVAAWRESPYFSEAERAALTLTEAATRLSDRADAVPDEVWNEAARHYNEAALASLVMSIAVINLWNRLNATTRQLSGEWTAQYS
jgi:AhpD family alkylhydroperoxidase